MKLGKQDKLVIKAFVDKRSLEGPKLSSEGNRLDGLWMGGRGIALWRGGKIHLPDLGSRAAQTVQNAIRREAPPNWFADSVDRASSAASLRSAIRRDR